MTDLGVEPALSPASAGTDLPDDSPAPQGAAENDPPAKRARVAARRASGHLYKAKQHFLTYPDSPRIEKDVLFEKLRDIVAEKSADVTVCYIGLEHHKLPSGEPDPDRIHYHVYLAVDKPIYVKSDSFDWTTTVLDDLSVESTVNVHGNYQSVNKKHDVIRYVTKEDESPFIFGLTNPQTVLAAGKTNSAVAYQELAENGYNLTTELVKKYPQFFLRDLEKIKRSCELAKQIQSLEETKLDPPTTGWYPWQSTIIEILSLSRDSSEAEREIIWIYDPVGNKGKSFLCKFLHLNNRAFYTTGGKKTDIAHAYDGQDIVLFDFARTQEEHVNYTAIEELKNGMIFSSKYQSMTKVSVSTTTKKISPPWVVCFANYQPNLEACSADRWGTGPYLIAEDNTLRNGAGEIETFERFKAMDQDTEELVESLLSS